MKKILFSIMLLFCATAVMAQDELGFIPVSNAQELYDAVKSDLSSDGKISYAKIKLIDDIYLSELPEGTVTLNNTFSGTIDGSYWEYDEDLGEVIQKGHTIYGGHKNELDKDSLRTCDYLFTYLRGATFESVGFKFIRVTSDDRDYQGVIASQAWNTTFHLVVVEKCYVFCDENYAGAFVGRAEKCTFDNVLSLGSDVRVYGVGAGGLVGYSTKSQYITSSTLYASSVWADGSNWKNHAWVGGFVGYSVEDKFNSCMNTAMVGGNQNQVGGFVGESTNSDFYNCKNSGMTAHVYEDDFNKNCKEERARLQSLAEDNKMKHGYAILGLTLDVTMMWNLYCAGLGTKLFYFIAHHLSYTLANPVMTVIVVGLLVATVVTIEILEGDDEIGGICALANGGTFELCSNFAYTKCKDENGGGIVGLGYGVTINNCYNGGSFEYDEDDMGGSIIGSALTGDNGKKSKVTNCCANVAYHLIGNTGGLDPTSGNNYRLSDNGETEDTWCEMAVDSAMMKSGIVAMWLNQSPENRNLKPWRQKLTCDPTNPNDTIIDFAPTLDAEHPVITIDDLEYTEISDADELIAFSEVVNGGNQFARAVLTADINMAGKPWTPIGKNESHKHFRGIFDGRGHKISGLTCSSNKAVGLFGAVHTGAEIRNVIIGDDCKFTSEGGEGAGGIVGRVAIGWNWGNVLIENCASYAGIKVNKHGGGILGHVSTGDNSDGVKVCINNCFSSGIITADNGNSGLIAGYMKNHGYVSNCWSNGQLRTTNSKNAPFSSENSNGGEYELMVGYSDKLTISNCYVINPIFNVDNWGDNFVYDPQNGVEELTSFQVGNGAMAFMLNGKTNDVTKSLAWQQNLGKDDFPVFGSKGIYHTRNVSESSNGYGTVCLPYPVQSDDNIRYYTFSEAVGGDNEVLLKFEYAANMIPAGTPLLFRVCNIGENTFCNADGDLSGWPDVNPISPASATWRFWGTFVNREFTDQFAEDVFYVSNGAIKNAKKISIAPFRAYFIGPKINEFTAAGAKSIRIVLDDDNSETTALKLVGEDLVPVKMNSKTYSLMGTEVNSNYRGIVIKNGKKMTQNR